jgi:GDP-4-dehydro-6-deoxy-D-mannose reductase
VAGWPLVTGATGFAGGHLVRHLLEREDRVAAWGNPHGTPLPVRRDPRVAWQAVDLLDAAAVQRALEAGQPSAVYHCAGIADVHAAWGRSALALRVNVIGTHHLLEALERLGLDVPVVVVGSALVYRATSEVLTEASPIGPDAPYALSKLAQEMLAGRVPGRILIARPFNHAGPGQSDAFVTSSFARQIAEIEAGIAPPVLHVGNLDARRDITDVRDVVRAYRLLADRGTPRRPYNICSGRSHRVGDLLDRLVAMARTRIAVELDPARLRPSDNPMVLGSFARIQQETGWMPAIPIQQTLADLLEHWRGRARQQPGSAR